MRLIHQRYLSMFDVKCIHDNQPEPVGSTWSATVGIFIPQLSTIDFSEIYICSTDNHKAHIKQYSQISKRNENQARIAEGYTTYTTIKHHDTYTHTLILASFSRRKELEFFQKTAPKCQYLIHMCPRPMSPMSK